jgi:glucosamine-6-phosphate deaminase
MNVLRFDSESAWVHTICSVWRDRLRSKPDVKMCLPSGKTPVAIYAEMARSVGAGLVSFSRATIFALDEFGGVSAEDPGSTRQMLKQQLVDHVDLPANAFRCLDPEASDVSRECAGYEAAIAEGFDLMVLGIGTNGHLGMN